MLRFFSQISTAVKSLSTLTAMLFVSSFAYAEAAPDFTLKSSTGENVRLAEQQGQVVMLNFWASWCGPCRQEMPLLDAMSKKYSKMGFVLYGVNVEKDNKPAKKMLADLGVTFPILFDPESKLSSLYNVDAMPTSVFIDKKGQIRYVARGYKPGDENKYREHIMELVGE
jgi:thiol-disulfide isomerase/thioredoxin